MIQIYFYLSGRQTDCLAVSRGLSPSLKSVEDYILACFESILQQQTNTPDTDCEYKIELMVTYKLKPIRTNRECDSAAIPARNFALIEKFLP